MSYEHTQHGWPVRIAFGLTALVFLVMVSVHPLDRPMPRTVLVVGAAVAVALGLMWSRMTIRLEGDMLRWWFGPGWPRFALPLSEIRTVETTRTTLGQGWGVHRTRRGWLYNIAGRDAVLITRADGKRLLLGSDEPRRLKSALERAVAQGPAGEQSGQEVLPAPDRSRGLAGTRTPGCRRPPFRQRRDRVSSARSAGQARHPAEGSAEEEVVAWAVRLAAYARVHARDAPQPGTDAGCCAWTPIPQSSDTQYRGCCRRAVIVSTAPVHFPPSHEGSPLSGIGGEEDGPQAIHSRQQRARA